MANTKITDLSQALSAAPDDRLYIVTNYDPTNPTLSGDSQQIAFSALTASIVGGTAGTSGTSGVDGSSGTSGGTGSSGTDGTSGTSGVDGSSGTSGATGSSGTDGTSGTSGVANILNNVGGRLLVATGNQGEINSESNLTFSNGQFNITGDTIQYGIEYGETTKSELVSVGTTTIISIPTSSGCSADFNYCVTESGGAMRAGTVKSVWNSSTAGYMDYSTSDIVGTTNDISFTVSIVGSDVVLNAVILSGTWTIKTSVKIII